MTTAYTQRLLRRAEVMKITGLSHASLYRLRDFPRPIRIGERASAWVAEEVDQWIARRIEDRDAGRKPDDPQAANATAARLAKRARAA